MRLSLWVIASILVLSFQTVYNAHAVTKVSQGNVNASQPPIPSASKRRTSRTGSSFDAKYQRIKDLIAADRKMQAKIKKAAGDYGIDPIHIVGALVGEHTYNVDAFDRLQTYYVKALSYLKTNVAFEHQGVSVTDFVSGPAFAKCQGSPDSYDLWSCREGVWNANYRAKTKDGVDWPNDRFGRVFFQPFYAGQTFGLGQLNPLTALKVTDKVSSVSGKRRLRADRAPQVYNAIMDPDLTFLYMAAVLRTAIDAYKSVGWDISNNPGITATLYNLGDVRNRARRTKARGKRPEENYYGWLVNQKRSELEAIIR